MVSRFSTHLSPLLSPTGRDVSCRYDRDLATSLLTSDDWLSGPLFCHPERLMQQVCDAPVPTKGLQSHARLAFQVAPRATLRPTGRIEPANGQIEGKSKMRRSHWGMVGAVALLAVGLGMPAVALGQATPMAGSAATPEAVRV